MGSLTNVSTKSANDGVAENRRSAVKATARMFCQHFMCLLRSVGRGKPPCRADTKKAGSRARRPACGTHTNVHGQPLCPEALHRTAGRSSDWRLLRPDLPASAAQTTQERPRETVTWPETQPPTATGIAPFRLPFSSPRGDTRSRQHFPFPLLAAKRIAASQHRPSSLRTGFGFHAAAAPQHDVRCRKSCSLTCEIVYRKGIDDSTASRTGTWNALPIPHFGQSKWRALRHSNTRPASVVILINAPFFRERGNFSLKFCLPSCRYIYRPKAIVRVG